MTKPTENHNLVSQSKNSLLAAQNLIDLSHHEPTMTNKDKSLLAAAHYTMSSQKNLSLKQSQMHLNSAIALLQPLKNTIEKWNSQITWAYFKRAEILEKRGCFEAARFDYQKVIDILSTKTPQDNTHSLLLIKSYLANTHLYLNHVIDNKKNHHVDLIKLLGWVSAAESHLKKLSSNQSHISLLVYTYQTAGIVLTKFNYLYEAIQSFRKAIHTTFQIEDIETSAPLLVDLYSCLSYLYQGLEEYQFIQQQTDETEYSSIYFTLSLLFKETHEYLEEENTSLFNIVELVNRATDPYEPILPPPIIRDMIDALIYARSHLMNRIFPNQLLVEELEDCMLDNIYLQHLSHLLTEYTERTNPHANILEIATPAHSDLSLTITTVLNNPYNNVASLEDWKKELSNRKCTH